MARREGIDPATLVGKTPAAPDLPVELTLYISAFLALDSEREYLRPIPWTAKAKYCEFYGLDRGQVDWLMEILTRVDNAVLIDREARQRRENKQMERRGNRRGKNPT